MSASAWISGVSAIVSVLSVAITVWMNYSRKRLDDQKEFMSSAFYCLEAAFDHIKPEKEGLSPPKRRINWLNSARNIEYFKAFKPKITDKSLMLLWETKEEYWRSMFHKRLSHSLLNTPEYFNGDDDYAIDTRSAFIVVTFSYWNEERADPIENYSQLDLRDVYSQLNHIPAMGLKFKIEDELRKRALPNR